MSDTRGFVLVNALILVMALSAVAVGLLMLAETARARQNAGQISAQLGLYLDGFEALALTLLNADRTGAGATDHAAEAWARPVRDLPVDRGSLSGHLNDLQGRFNVNWLSNPEDVAAQAAFARLLTRLGLSDVRGGAILAFLTPSATVTTSRRAQYNPPVAVVSGPVLMVEQLMLVPGMRASEMARLRPYITALPGDSALNVNTASGVVLQSLLPDVGPAVVAQIVQHRQRQPFTSVEEFIGWLGTAAADLDEERFAVGSSWFQAEIEAQLEGHEMRRDTVFERQPLPKGTRVSYRLNKRD